MIAKNTLLVSGVLIFVSCAQEKTVREPRVYSIEQFYGNTAVTGGTFSPDGSKILVSTNATGIFNAVALPVDGSAPVQLTHSTDESIFAVSYMPDGERILYQA